MKIKRIKSLRVNSTIFTIKWNRKSRGASYNYHTNIIEIGTYNCSNNKLLMILCHELQEIVAVEMSVRLMRPDCDSDFIFVYDHRQHDAMADMFAGLLMQFID